MTNEPACAPGSGSLKALRLLGIVVDHDSFYGSRLFAARRHIGKFDELDEPFRALAFRPSSCMPGTVRGINGGHLVSGL
jgi:hypothetical protein